MLGAPAVLVRPITDADTDAVGDFLHKQLNPRVSAASWAGITAPPWGTDGPNRGFLLLHGGDMVGVYVAVYSKREIAGDLHTFCNLAAFCVLEEFRASSLRLVRALLAQKGIEFTDFSPSGAVVALNERLGFTHLDTTSHLAVNLPVPGRRGVRVIDSPHEIEERLSGPLLRLYRDHRRAVAARQAVLQSGDRLCYVVFRRDRRKGLPLFASILFVGGDRTLLNQGWAVFRRYLVRRHRLPFTLAEARVVGPRLPLSVRVSGRPRMFRSHFLADADIDYLYSELTNVEW